MATYVSLVNWTEQGAKSYADSVDRTQAATKLAESLGGKIVSILWTMGAYDLVATTEFPDDDSVSAFALKLGSQGNVRTLTMRAYNAADMARIIAKTK